MLTHPSQGNENTNSGPEAAAINWASTSMSPLFSRSILIGCIGTPHLKRTLRDEYPRFSFLISFGQIIQGICITPKQNTLRISDGLESGEMTIFVANSQFTRSVGDLSTTMYVNYWLGSSIILIVFTSPLDTGSSIYQLSIDLCSNSSRKLRFSKFLGSL